MKLLPQSLFGRNLLLLAGLIVLAQLSAALLFRFGLIEPRIGRFAALTASQIRATHAGLEAAVQIEQEQVFSNRLQSTGIVRIVAQQQAPEVFARSTLWPVNDFLASLQEELGSGYQLHWRAPPDPVLWVQLDLPQGRYWLGYKAERLVADASIGLLAVFSLITLLALAGAVVIQQRLNRPLTQLTRAAQRVGQGDLSVHLPTNGSSEIAQVAKSFNQMSASLVRLENDRAIMLAGVSHDLRTPLSKMRIAIELLRSRHDAQLLDDMQRHIENVDVIIGQFLAYARIGNDEARETLNLEPLLRELVADYARAGTHFELVTQALPALSLQPIATRRMLTNLMDNALRYGRAPFSVYIEHKAKFVEVCIRDSGDGIATHAQEEVKKPFVRMDVARARPGSGLGLAIADRVARMHGGTLQLRNLSPHGFEARAQLPM
jgi:two-component system, OmpR family, osmolarity sensor histidine kinase EnvZ